MSHYCQRLDLAASPAVVYAALTTPDGLRGWWTRDCDVSATVGDSIHLRFGPHYKRMRIECLVPEREVRWRCTAAQICLAQLKRQDEWVGTQLVFRLMPNGAGRTRLEFEHIGLVPDLECHALCCDGWRHYLGSLQRFVETGRGTPCDIAATTPDPVRSPGETST